jgi:predicted ester cyclase
MSAEQTVRDFMSTFNEYGAEEAAGYLADDLVLTFSPPPTTLGKQEFLGQGMIIKEGMPDFHWTVREAVEEGDTVTVYADLWGTHTGMFRASMLAPGAPDVPPTGIEVSATDTVQFTVYGDQIARVDFLSGEAEGLGAILAQLGVELPGG